MDKFVVEARSLAKFYKLPGIVSVRDFFRENGTTYIVMEYIEGITLKQYMKNQGGRLPAGDVLELVKPLIRSLSQIHAEGIIHRDISPDNIMLTRNGDVKLLDFGAARSISSDGAKSLSVLLKPGYAPEEQYRSRGNQGPWTDVYALCATIYKAITGETPPEALERIHEDTLIPPSQKGAVLSDYQEKAILKGMAVLQRDRYDSIASLYADLYGEQHDAASLTQNETDEIKVTSTPSSSKVNMDIDRDKTVPLDGHSVKMDPQTDNGIAKSPISLSSNAPETQRSRKISTLAILTLYAIGAFLMRCYEADVMLWIMAALDIAYIGYRTVKSTPVGLVERLSVIGVRCSVVLFLTVMYLGDNSRAFGYGGSPDPGFAVGYGGAIVLMILLHINAGYEAVKLIRWSKNISDSSPKIRAFDIFRFSGLIVVLITFIIFSVTLYFVAKDVITYTHTVEVLPETIPETIPEVIPENSVQPTPSTEPDESPTPTPSVESTTAPSESSTPAAEGSTGLNDSPAKYPVSPYPANYSTYNYQGTRFTVFGDWLSIMLPIQVN